jgi:hypothetical protein
MAISSRARLGSLMTTTNYLPLNDELYDMMMGQAKMRMEGCGFVLRRNSERITSLPETEAKELALPAQVQ